MNTYLLTWGEWTGDFSGVISGLKLHKGVCGRWSVAKHLRNGKKAGDRVLMKRNGPQGGIVGVGYILPNSQGSESAAYEGRAWGDKGEMSWYVEVVWVCFVESPLIPWEELKNKHPAKTWQASGSGNLLEENLADDLLRKLSTRWGKPIPKSCPKEIDCVELHNEGDAQDVDDAAPKKATAQKLSFRGAGYSHDEDNKKEVEQAAIRFVTREYERLGYRVTSVEREKIGYDLLCRNRKGEAHVEVKGVSGSSQEIFLTSNEWASAQNDQDFSLAIVTNALSKKPILNSYFGSELKSLFWIEPSQYRLRWKNG